MHLLPHPSVVVVILLLACSGQRLHSQTFDPRLIKLKQTEVQLPGGTKATKIETGQKWIHRIAFSPEGKQVGVLFRFTPPALFSTDTWQMERLLPGMRDLEFSRNGKQFVTAEGNDGLRLWNRSEVAVSTNYLGNQRSLVRSAAFSPDGSLVASAHDSGDIKLWNTDDSKLKATLKQNDQAIYCVRFSPSGDTLYSCGVGNTIELWDVQSLQHKETIKGPPTSAVLDLAVCIDGKRLISFHQKVGTMLWNLETKRAEIKSGYVALDCSPTEPIAAIARDKVLFFDTRTGKETASVNLTTEKAPFLVSALRFTPDGKRLAIGANSGEILLLEVPTLANRD